jgi:hypothetical protein
MSLTPHEVILLYQEYDKNYWQAPTSLQKNEITAQLKRELHCVEWEVEVINVENQTLDEYILKGKVFAPKKLLWRKIGFHEIPFEARLHGGDGLRKRLVTLMPGERIRLEGSVSLDRRLVREHDLCFIMNSARLLD